jgi:HPt (histidine-containing phosphotransfer) domain-containing protein
LDWDDSGALDPDVLEELKALQQSGGPNLLAELAAIFIAEMPRAIGGMRRAVDTSDFEALAREAHRLKGSSGQMGAARLALLCQEIESSVRANQPVDLTVLALLEQESEEVGNVLTRLLRDRASNP